MPKIPKIWGKTQPFWIRLEPITISESSIIWALFSCNRLNLLGIWLWKIDIYYTHLLLKLSQSAFRIDGKVVMNSDVPKNTMENNEYTMLEPEKMIIFGIFQLNFKIWGYTQYLNPRSSTQTWLLLPDFITFYINLIFM